MFQNVTAVLRGNKIQNICRCYNIRLALPVFKVTQICKEGSEIIYVPFSQGSGVASGNDVSDFKTKAVT